MKLKFVLKNKKTKEEGADFKTLFELEEES
jgi:hypothetical protein